MKKWILLCLAVLLFSHSWAQKAQLRGFIYNAENGNPLQSATVRTLGQPYGDYADQNGFYSISAMDKGEYTLQVTAIGYDTIYFNVSLKEAQVVTKNFYLNTSSSKIAVVNVSAAKQRKKKEVVISLTTIKPKHLQRIPSVGGEPDLVQYLQVLPGVVFSGDQGGQLYIRGGSPVMNRVMLDGLTIYNPFHSIGLFSVFDSDILKVVEVHSAGFSADYGGRISAIVDVETRDGDKNRFRGKINSSPFNSKILLEGPLKKFEAGKGSSSYILSYKNSYLDRTAPIFYSYIDNGELPYSFGDLYAKYSANMANGSYIKLFGFDFNDAVSFENTTSYNWKSQGLGAEFLLIPGSSKTIVDGSINYSDYLIQQKEQDNRPRKSGIGGYNVALNFTNFLKDNNQIRYGIEMNAFRTDFEIYNSLDRRISQFENTTEISMFINHRAIIKQRFILESGFRLQRYASLQENSPEPRIRLKYNITNKLRFKGATGLYSQNLMSAVSDRDVVNLFYGFLSGPENLPKTFDGKEVKSKLQRSRHAVAGFEFDLTPTIEINAETYIKDFTQITNVNRNKIFDNNSDNAGRPDHLKQDYIVERGQAYGFDITLLYETDQIYFWAVYSYNNVSRFDGFENYQPHFDRRHNINLVASYDFGEEKDWSANLRWNFGSGFPFTQTQGFYELIDFKEGGTTDYITANGDLGILYASINTGRLPYYHRLDASLKKTFIWKSEDKKDEKKMEAILSITNVYDRKNIFYFDRVAYERVNQLPFLPSISLSYAF
ncbi:MAG: TonB-dependent receptor [Bacteroidia bacterium]